VVLEGGKNSGYAAVFPILSIRSLSVVEKGKKTIFINKKHQIKRNKLSAITIIPAISPAIDKWCFPYFSAEGKSSSNEI